MKNVYPEAEPVTPFTPIDSEAALAARIITAMNNDISKASAIGECLAGSDDVALFNRLWSEIDEEGKTFRAENPKDHATQTSYTTALSVKAVHLDPALFLAGLKDEQGVSTWTDLKSKYASIEAI